MSTHKILEDWTPDINNEEHNECVLYKSQSPKEVIVEDTNEVAPSVWDTDAKSLPETGPAQYILLFLLSLLLWFGILKMKRKHN
jgi:hypothetical protein